MAAIEVSHCWQWHWIQQTTFWHRQTEAEKLKFEHYYYIFCICLLPLHHIMWDGVEILCDAQVYVRRAYTAYELSCLQHDQLEGGLCIVKFMFLLPSSHPNRFVSMGFMVKYSFSIDFSITCCPALFQDMINFNFWLNNFETFPTSLNVIVSMQIALIESFLNCIESFKAEDKIRISFKWPWS